MKPVVVIGDLGALNPIAPRVGLRPAAAAAPRNVLAARFTTVARARPAQRGARVIQQVTRNTAPAKAPAKAFRKPTNVQAQVATQAKALTVAATPASYFPIRQYNIHVTPGGDGSTDTSGGDGSTSPDVTAPADAGASGAASFTSGGFPQGPQGFNDAVLSPPGVNTSAVFAAAQQGQGGGGGGSGTMAFDSTGAEGGAFQDTGQGFDNSGESSSLSPDILTPDTTVNPQATVPAGASQLPAPSKVPIVIAGVLGVGFVGGIAWWFLR